jgi:methionine-rich copper-binding protein CopC
LTTLSVAAATTAAQAHAQLISTTPVDGAVLPTAPDSVTFAFDADLLPGANTVSINDEKATSVFSARVQPEGASVTVPWPSMLPPGTYQVAYRVVSADGHPVLGAITITVGGARPASSSPAASPSDGGGATTGAALPAEVASVEGNSALPWAIAVVAVAAVAVLAGLVALVWRRGRLEQ